MGSLWLDNAHESYLVFWALFLFSLEVFKYFFLVISNPRSKGLSNSLYKGFTVVHYIYSEIDFNKIPIVYFKF